MAIAQALHLQSTLLNSALLYSFDKYRHYN